jgi:hypothetical protein
MPDTGPASARANVGGGSRDGPRDTDAAEQHRGDIGNALRAELAIRPVAPAGHAISDHSGRK